MQVFNAMQLKAGAKVEQNKMLTLTQPVQFCPTKDKDEDWLMQNMDWLEMQGTKQLRRNAKRLLKNYKLAKGIIDRSDYICEENPEMADLIDVLTREDQSALELKYYPIIPNVVNVLCNEFSKRVSKVVFRAVDDISYNELLEAKRNMIEEVLLKQASMNQMQKLVEMGQDPNSDEAQQALSPDKLKTLPEIEAFFKKDYRSMSEIWASHQKIVDDERFHMQELEEMGFRDSLIADREFWHFKMNEDDYDIEIWNPLLTFYHKSLDSRYISSGNFVGKMNVITVPDVIDKYGWMMTEDQMTSLESIYPIRAAGYMMSGLQNDGSYYDATKSHAWNTQMPSLGMRQYMSAYDNPSIYGDIVKWITADSEDMLDYGDASLLRETIIYWKSQRRVGHLTKISMEGDLRQDIVSEDYKITDKPMYNTVLIKQKSKDNLVFGEHIDWFWINEVWGGIKIGPNRPSNWGQNTVGGLNPIYLGLNGGKPGRLPFQFKGDATMYGCKLPVEGAVFGDRNTKSVALVNTMAPFQIGFNIINNQIADILVDELGTVILLDQNTLPRHSMGEDWGKHNFQKAYVAMKNFQMLPLDTSITNTENALNFQHFQVLNLEQTNRLLSRIQLGQYFKTEAFSVIGLSPERMAQPTGRQTATGVEQNTNASYAQTEHYFIQHSDNLMPRVHAMRTDLAQYYHSRNPSVRLSYITTADEKVNFQMNGTDLLLRDLNVFCTTKTNTRAIMEQLKTLATTSNTMGASIYDLGTILKADSMAELTMALKATDEKTQQIRQQEQEYQKQLQDEQVAAREKEQQAQIQYETDRDDKMIRKEITVAEIKAASYGQGQDVNANMVSDYTEAMQGIQKEANYQDTMNFKREQEINKNANTQQKIGVEREKISAQRDVADKNLQIARENQTKAELQAKNKLKKDKK